MVQSEAVGSGTVTNDDWSMALDVVIASAALQ